MEREKLKFTEMLEEGFQRYDEALENGCNDPLWADGVDLNLIENHIIIAKRNIEEVFSIEDYPDIHYRVTPRKIDSGYMVKPDKIQERAKGVLDTFNNYFYLEELKDASCYLDKNQLLETGVRSVLCLVQYLDETIKEDDLIGMRRLSKDPDYKMKEFEKTCENLREINMEEGRQISLPGMMMWKQKERRCKNK